MASGIFGFLGYDMVRQMERLGAAKPDPIGVPDALMIRPTLVLVFDAVKDEIVVITPVFPAPSGQLARPMKRRPSTFRPRLRPLRHHWCRNSRQMMPLPAFPRRGQIPARRNMRPWWPPRRNTSSLVTSSRSC